MAKNIQVLNAAPYLEVTVIVKKKLWPRAFLLNLTHKHECMCVYMFEVFPYASDSAPVSFLHVNLSFNVNNKILSGRHHIIISTVVFYVKHST